MSDIDVFGFFKLFFEKAWFWIAISVFSIFSLYNVDFLNWLGIASDKRWVVGIVAVFSISFTFQMIIDFIKLIIVRKKTIKNIDNLTQSALLVLNNIVRDGKKTLKVKADLTEQCRIVAHFDLPIIIIHDNKYAKFPDYLWKELKKRFKVSE